MPLIVYPKARGFAGRVPKPRKPRKKEPYWPGLEVSDDDEEPPPVEEKKPAPYDPELDFGPPSPRPEAEPEAEATEEKEQAEEEASSKTVHFPAAVLKDHYEKRVQSMSRKRRSRKRPPPSVADDGAGEDSASAPDTEEPAVDSHLAVEGPKEAKMLQDNETESSLCTQEAGMAAEPVDKTPSFQDAAGTQSMPPPPKKHKANEAEAAAGMSIMKDLPSLEQILGRIRQALTDFTAQGTVAQMVAPALLPSHSTVNRMEGACERHEAVAAKMESLISQYHQLQEDSRAHHPTSATIEDFKELVVANHTLKEENKELRSEKEEFHRKYNKSESDLDELRTKLNESVLIIRRVQQERDEAKRGCMTLIHANDFGFAPSLSPSQALVSLGLGSSSQAFSMSALQQHSNILSVLEEQRRQLELERRQFETTKAQEEEALEARKARNQAFFDEQRHQLDLQRMQLVKDKEALDEKKKRFEEKMFRKMHKVKVSPPKTEGNDNVEKTDKTGIPVVVSTSKKRKSAPSYSTRRRPVDLSGLDSLAAVGMQSSQVSKTR